MSSDQDREGSENREPLEYSGRSGLIYCGLCGALNPSSNHYCARCGSTLVDAFHATEGLRVFQLPDDASRIVQIVSSGTSLEVLPADDAPADYARIRLGDGRLGYVKLSDVIGSKVEAPSASTSMLPDINTNARGCVTSSAALWALALLVICALFGVVILWRARPEDAGLLATVFCITLGPVSLVTIGAYVAARTREDQLAYEEAELAANLHRDAEAAE